MYIFKDFIWLGNSHRGKCSICVWHSYSVETVHSPRWVWLWCLRNSSLFLHFCAFFMGGALSTRNKFKHTYKLILAFCLKFVVSSLFLTICRVLEKRHKSCSKFLYSRPIRQGKRFLSLPIATPHFSMEKELGKSRVVYWRNKINRGVDGKDNTHSL